MTAPVGVSELDLTAFVGREGAGVIVTEADGRRLSGTLESAARTSVGRATDSDRNFALVLAIPGQDAMEQGIKSVEVDGVGAWDLFLVPIEQTADGLRYEIVFSRVD